jgi:choline-glycine betaine transporter
VPSIPGSAEAVPAAGPAHAKAKRENPPWLTNVMWAFAVILITAVLLALINLG